VDGLEDSLSAALEMKEEIIDSIGEESKGRKSLLVDDNEKLSLPKPI
jgi:hypothetical protein